MWLTGRCPGSAGGLPDRLLVAGDFSRRPGVCGSGAGDFFADPGSNKKFEPGGIHRFADYFAPFFPYLLPRGFPVCLFWRDFTLVPSLRLWKAAVLLLNQRLIHSASFIAAALDGKISIVSQPDLSILFRYFQTLFKYSGNGVRYGNALNSTSARQRALSRRLRLRKIWYQPMVTSSRSSRSTSSQDSRCSTTPFSSDKTWVRRDLRFLARMGSPVGSVSSFTTDVTTVAVG